MEGQEALPDGKHCGHNPAPGSEDNDGSGFSSCLSGACWGTEQVLRQEELHGQVVCSGSGGLE